MEGVCAAFGNDFDLRAAVAAVFGGERGGENGDLRDRFLVWRDDGGAGLAERVNTNAVDEVIVGCYLLAGGADLDLVFSLEDAAVGLSGTGSVGEVDGIAGTGAGPIARDAGRGAEKLVGIAAGGRKALDGFGVETGSDRGVRGLEDADIVSIDGHSFVRAGGLESNVGIARGLAGDGDVIDCRGLEVGRGRSKNVGAGRELSKGVAAGCRTGGVAYLLVGLVREGDSGTGNCCSRGVSDRAA